MALPAEAARRSPCCNVSESLVYFGCPIHLRFRPNVAVPSDRGVTEDSHVGCPKAAFVNFTSRLRSATAEGDSPEKRRKTDLPDLSGTTVGRFSLEALLGRGGMGEVYRAYDTKLKRLVALKRIIGAPHDQYRERLWTEAQYASRLNDARIAAVYDMFEEGNEIFLVMSMSKGVRCGSG